MGERGDYSLAQALAKSLMESHGDRWHRMTILDIAEAVVSKFEQVGWCWPDRTYPSALHLLPDDGEDGPPMRHGVRPVYAPVVACCADSVNAAAPICTPVDNASCAPVENPTGEQG